MASEDKCSVVARQVFHVAQVRLARPELLSVPSWGSICRCSYEYCFAHWEGPARYP